MTLELRNIYNFYIFPPLIANFIICRRIRSSMNVIISLIMLALTKVLLNFDRRGGSSFSWQINCSWRCQSWWTISINIKVKALLYNICPRSLICAQTSEMVPVWCHFVYARRCLFARAHISFDGCWSDCEHKLRGTRRV